MANQPGFIDANNVEIKKRLLPDNELEVSFIDEGSSCLAVELTEREPVSFGGMQLILKDLELTCASINAALTYWEKVHMEEKTQETAQFSLSDLDHVVLWNCFAAAIITYGKCFASAKGRNAQFPSKLISSLNEKNKITHKEIIHLRNSWIAHGGITNNEYGKAILLMDPTNKKLPGIIYHATFRGLPDAISLKDFLALAETNLSALRKHQSDTSQKWFNTKMIKQDLTALFKKANYWVRYRSPRT